MICFIIGNSLYEERTNTKNIKEGSSYKNFNAYIKNWLPQSRKSPLIFIPEGDVSIFQQFIKVFPDDLKFYVFFHYAGDGDKIKIEFFQDEYNTFKKKLYYFTRVTTFSKSEDKSLETSSSEGKVFSYADIIINVLKNNRAAEYNIEPYTKSELENSDNINGSDYVAYSSYKNSLAFDIFERNIGKSVLKTILTKTLNKLKSNISSFNKNLTLKLLTPGHSGSYVMLVQNVGLHKGENNLEFVLKISPENYVQNSDKVIDDDITKTHLIKEKVYIFYQNYHVRLFKSLHKYEELQKKIKRKIKGNENITPILKNTLEKHQVFLNKFDGKGIDIISNSNLWRIVREHRTENILSPTTEKMLAFAKLIDDYKQYSPLLYSRFQLVPNNDTENTTLSIHNLLFVDRGFGLIKKNIYPSIESYIHGDLHTRNIMVGKMNEDDIKFIDFDLVPELHDEHPLKDYAKLAVYVELEMVRYIKGAGVITDSEEDLEIKDLIDLYTNFVHINTGENSKEKYHLEINPIGKIKLIIDGINQIFECANDFLLGEENYEVEKEFEKFCEDKNFTSKQLLYFQFNLAKLHYYIKVATYDTPVVYQRLWCMKAALLLMEAVQEFDRKV